MFKPLLLAVSWVLTAVVVSAAQEAIVLVADGAGDYRTLSTAISHVVTEDELPLLVEPACWSHGFMRSVPDQVDLAHSRAEGRRLASKVLAYRAACPERPVYLVAYSAGALVVLAAADHLPSDSVERIVLLSPTASAYTDIRPALRCSRQGVDVFHSCRDRFAWLVGFVLIGKEGHFWPRIAARIGFLEPKQVTEEEAALYTKLRQYAWNPSWCWTGHQGGHFAVRHPDFLRYIVLPLLTQR